MSKKMLLIIDPQNDFINGSLAVEGADGAMLSLARHIERHGTEYDVIAVTCDWHPVNHISFKDNGGIWPPHCVQHTNGACISPIIFDAIRSLENAHYVTFTKGDNPKTEEYSFMDNKESANKFLQLVKDEEITEIDCCGNALNYCVSESIIGMWAKGLGDKITLLTKFSPAIGDATKVLEDLASKGIKIL